MASGGRGGRAEARGKGGRGKGGKGETLAMLDEHGAEGRRPLPAMLDEAHGGVRQARAAAPPLLPPAPPGPRMPGFPPPASIARASRLAPRRAPIHAARVGVARRVVHP